MRNTAFLLLAFLAALAAGCRSVDNPAAPADGSIDPAAVTAEQDAAANTMHTYEVTIENLSAGQPLSPPVAATHRKSMRIFKVNKHASPEIEAIAEDGNPVPMFDLLSASPNVTEAVSVGVPLSRMGTTTLGFSDNVTFQIQGYAKDRFSLATMLICTNDGFTGLSRVKLPKNRKVYYGRAYDAGTEENTELSTDIVDAASDLGPFPLPGDPNGNENAAVATSPHDKIRKHKGIGGTGDLSETDHAWEKRVIRVTIVRL